MGSAIARTVAGENDAVIRAVTRHNIVETGRLIRDVHDRRRHIAASDHRSQVRDFIELPDESGNITRTDWRPDNHAEDGPGATPMHRRIPHRNANPVL